MRYYPINLDIKGRHCLVVGGGGVGFRKVTTLLACGGLVTVVSPALVPELQALADSCDITWHSRGYRASDLANMFLVIGATNDEQLNNQVSTDAHGQNMLCNIADRPAACNFILPSIVHRGDLVLTISTSGKSPAFAKQLRKELEKQFGAEYKAFLLLMGAIRDRLLSQAHEPEAHKPLFEKLINAGLLTRIRENDTDGINRLLFETLGSGYELNRLIDKD
ncbi:MAG: bifunctional precorrin-2 dehydrogenase/sirohydrochlorin ferrochelatase [Desulfobacterales bacterium]|jgi:precorrin-2 dehydrogenase/sirohydrochlorin ferrochelatase|nr:bifunctional precorrin-2 dehydrogenase/sirohydrochlorin ferrochelatase [Desulfobacterales bacterium]